MGLVFARPPRAQHLVALGLQQVGLRGLAARWLARGRNRSQGRIGRRGWCWGRRLDGRGSLRTRRRGGGVGFRRADKSHIALTVRRVGAVRRGGRGPHRGRQGLCCAATASRSGGARRRVEGRGAGESHLAARSGAAKNFRNCRAARGPRHRQAAKCAGNPSHFFSPGAASVLTLSGGRASRILAVTSTPSRLFLRRRWIPTVPGALACLPG